MCEESKKEVAGNAGLYEVGWGREKGRGGGGEATIGNVEQKHVGHCGSFQSDILCSLNILFDLIYLQGVRGTKNYGMSFH